MSSMILDPSRIATDAARQSIRAGLDVLKKQPDKVINDNSALAWESMSEDRQKETMILMVNAYANTVAPMFGGTLNMDASDFAVTARGHIDWDDFILKHRELLDRKFLSMPNHTTAISRKWSEVLRNRKPKIRKLLQSQLEKQLAGNPDAVATVMSFTHLADCIKMLYGDHVVVRPRHGGQGSRAKSADPLSGFTAAVCTGSQPRCVVDEEMSAMPSVPAPYSFSVVPQEPNPLSAGGAQLNDALYGIESAFPMGELHTFVGPASSEQAEDRLRNLESGRCLGHSNTSEGMESDTDQDGHRPCVDARDGQVLLSSIGSGTEIFPDSPDALRPAETTAAPSAEASHLAGDGATVAAAESESVRRPADDSTGVSNGDGSSSLRRRGIIRRDGSERLDSADGQLEGHGSGAAGAQVVPLTRGPKRQRTEGPEPGGGQSGEFGTAAAGGPAAAHSAGEEAAATGPAMGGRPPGAARWPPLCGLRCGPGDGNPILSLEELLRRAEARGTAAVRDVVGALAGTMVHFELQVHYVPALYRAKRPADPDAYAKRREVKYKAALLAMHGTGGGGKGGDAGMFRSARAAHGEWGAETRFEALVAADGLSPLGLAKVLVFSRRGEPFLVVVDRLCRNPRAARGVGRVGTELVQGVLGGFPGCRLALCTVRPAVPATFAQTRADSDAAAAFYEKAGFAPVTASGDLVALLRWMAAAAGGRGGAAPAGEWAALAALVREQGLEDSLPALEDHMTSPDRPITWWEYGGDGAGEGRGAAWLRATAGHPALAAAEEKEETAAEEEKEEMAGDSWPEPWVRAEAAAEVEWGGDWYQVEVQQVLLGRRGGARVLVFYIGGRKHETEWIKAGDRRRLRPPQPSGREAE